MGGDEYKNGEVQLKNMSDGEQKTIKTEKIVEIILAAKEQSHK